MFKTNQPFWLVFVPDDQAEPSTPTDYHS